MNKKTYITPNISIVEMSCTTIIAASGGGLTEGSGTSGGTVEGELGGGSGSGDSWSGSHSASRIYFDSWDDEEEEF